VPDKPLLILHGIIRTPPFSDEARKWAGFLLRKLQKGEMLSMPDSRPMPTIGGRCHELRVPDSRARVTWRIIYRVDEDAVIVADIFAKKTRTTPEQVIARSRTRLRKYDMDTRDS
jgi:phage-related protein